MDQQERSELIVTNFNRNFTGVSATAAAVVSRQKSKYGLRLVGQPLPDCPEPVNLLKALKHSQTSVNGRPVIWHVRRNAEMLAAITARDIFRMPIKTVFTSSARRFHSAFPRWLISRMDAVIATTKSAATFVPHVRAVAPHGVDTQKFIPAKNRLECWARSGFPGTMGVATVGRIRPEKGTDIFVDAMIKLLPELPGAKALVIGRATGEHRTFHQELQKRVIDADLTERILFTGEIDSDKLAQLLPGLSLMVAAPRYEGYGMTVLEAMASGVPVVASDTGNFVDFLGSECGHIAEPGDAQTVADLSRQILTTTGEVERAGAAARLRAVEHFSIEGEVDAIDRVYSTLWAAESADESERIAAQ